MISIQGALQVFPLSIGAEAGQIAMQDGENKESVVVLNVISDNGTIQVVIPHKSIDNIADGLKEAGKAAAEQPTTDLYVPQGGMAEVENIAKAKEQIEATTQGSK